MAKNRFKVEDLKNLNQFVGTNENIESHTNCVTRFRFNIKDKDKVDIKSIKELSFVRGTNWAGNQLQVIIGPEVTIVRDEYLKIFPENNMTQAFEATKSKKTFKQIILGFISNVMIPLIPALMAAGLMNALYQILVMTNALQNVSWSKGLPVTKIGVDTVTPNIISIVMFILADTGLKFLGLFVGYNTIKYISKAQVPQAMNVLIPLILAAPYLFASYSYPLFSIGAVKVNIQSYAGMLLPQIGGAFIYVYIDKWIRTWMPMVVDIVFRHFLDLIITGLLVFFAIGPVLGLIETGIYYTFDLVQKIPYGFGVGIFGFFWTPLVLTGMHLSLGTAIQNAIQNPGGVDGWVNPGSQLLAMTSITSITTIATTLAVFIRAKQSNMKNIAFGSLFPGAFGISEPTYYSISMLRPILFLPVMIARGVTGLFIGALDIRGYQPGGRGILGFTTAINDLASSDNLLKYIFAMILIFSVCFGLTLLLYKERKNDKKQILKLYNIITKKLKIKKDKVSKEQYKAKLQAIAKEFDNKEFLTELKELEKLIIKQNNLKFLMQKDEGKKKDSNTKLSEERTQKIKDLETQIQTKLEKVENVHLNMETQLQELFTPLIPLAKKDKSKANNIIFNTVHNLETNYNIVERMEV